MYTEMKNEIVEKLSVFLAELIGTGFLVFFGCMGCIAWEGATHLQMVINFGLVVMMMIQIFGCVSGAHLNPAITAAAFVYKLLTAQMACLYFVGQMIGGFMGYGLLKVVVPADRVTPNGTEHGLCITMHSDSISAIQATVIEMVATMILIWLFCSVVDPRNSKNTDTIPIKFGLTITALACAIGPLTGASMNPARSFGPALWNGDFKAHWVYWVGPMLGGFFAAFLYKLVFARDVAASEEDNDLAPEEYALKQKESNEA